MLNLSLGARYKILIPGLASVLLHSKFCGCFAWLCPVLRFAFGTSKRAALFQKKLGFFERQLRLSGGPFLLGAEMSYADVCLYDCMTSVREDRLRMVMYRIWRYI